MVSACLDIDISSKILQYVFENSLLFAGKQGRKPGFWVSTVLVMLVNKELKETNWHCGLRK